jgi:porin
VKLNCFLWVSLAFTCAATAHEACSTNAVDQASSETLTGHWLPREKLEDAGVAPFAKLTTEAWGNVAGGLEQRGWQNSLLDFGIKLDTAKLGWWQGGEFMAQAHWVENIRSSATFSDYTGGFNPVSGTMAGDHFRVYNLYYRHAWSDDAVAVKAGQIAVDDDFMKSDYSGLFLNAGFGSLPSHVGTPLATSLGNPPAFPIYPVAAPGAFMRLAPSKAWYTQLGLYYGRPGIDKRSNYGFDWASQSPPELGLFWESGVHYTLVERAASVRFGLSYHTGPVDDFSGNTGGTPPATVQTVPNYYLIHDLAILADAQGKTRLGMFARGGITPQPESSLVAFYIDGGLNWFAPLPERNDDVAGIGVSWTKFGSDYQKSTGPNGVAASETTLELTYRAQITRWLALQADTQFLFNPAVNPNSGRRETASVLGLRAEITF